MFQSQSIPLDLKMVQRQGNIVSDMDGEIVMMNIDNGKYYNLGRTGGLIWELLVTPVTVKQLLPILTAEYDVDPAVIESDVIAFLEHLHEEGLIDYLDQ